MGQVFKRSYVSIALAMSLFLVFSSQTALGAPEKKAWELIEWNKPVSMVERLSADTYILPEGWEKATKGVKELVFYNSGGLAHDIATAINMDLFEQMTGIRVKAIAVPAQIETVKTLATFLAKDGSIPLPLIGGPDRDMSTFAREEWITPIDFLYPPEVENLYSKAIKDNLYTKGHWWGSLETWLGIGLIFYRPSWLKNAGVDVPATWKDLYVAAKKCRTWGREELGPSYYGMVFAGLIENFMQPFQSQIYSQDGQIYKNGKPQFLSPEVKNAFEYWVRMIKEDIASEEVLNYSYFERGRAFGMGKAAFVAGSFTSYLMKYQTEFPEIIGDWDVTPPPKWSAEYPGEYGSGVATGNTGVVNRYADDNYQAVAMLYLDFLRSKQATRNELVVEANETAFLAQYEDPNIAQKIDWDLADRVAEKIGIPHPPHVEKLPFANVRKILSEHSRTEQFPPGFPQVMDAIEEQFAKAVLGKVSVEEALKAIQDFAAQIPSG